MTKTRYKIFMAAILAWGLFATPAFAITAKPKTSVVAKSQKKKEETAKTSSRVSVIDDKFVDNERGGRVINYRLYAPRRATFPAPVVIFSHGLGGSTGAAPYLGEALASHGYFAFHIQHPGSDKTAWDGAKTATAVKGALREAVKDPKVTIDRYMDIPFVIDQIEALNADGPLKGKIDTARIGIAGHSFGARSVLAASGELIGVERLSFKDHRIKAGLALSPNVPIQYMKNSRMDLRSVYSEITIPIFHITGTEDGDEIGLYGKDFETSQRTLPYENIRAPEQYLLVLEGADHASFGGARGDRKKDYTRYHEAVAAGAALFFDAYLKGDLKAKSDLQTAYPQFLLPGDEFDHK